MACAAVHAVPLHDQLQNYFVSSYIMACSGIYSKDNIFNIKEHTSLFFFLFDTDKKRG